MLRLRVIVPPDRSDEVVDLLRSSPAVAHLVVLPAASRQPAGDVVLADVAREGANALLDRLRALRVDQDGAIVIEHAGVMLSAAARRAARRTPGTDVDAVVWDELETVTGQETRLSATYLALLIVATIIASIGVLLDQPILIVGAMVVGPEFGPLAALSVGLVRRHWPVVRHSSLALVGASWRRSSRPPGSPGSSPGSGWSTSRCCWRRARSPTSSGARTPCRG